jgi:hypothetical protein
VPERRGLCRESVQGLGSGYGGPPAMSSCSQAPAKTVASAEKIQRKRGRDLGFSKVAADARERGD